MRCAEACPTRWLSPSIPDAIRAASRSISGTSGVVEAIVQQAGDPASLGHVGIVAFADHLYRCVATCRRLGFDAYAPDGVAMPAEYDPESGQAWCRDRIAYLLHDIMIRITERRAAVVGALWQ